MPSGLQNFNGVVFDARGVIQLDGDEATVPFPPNVPGIQVHQNFRRIHFLHGATWFNGAAPIGLYRLRFADGPSVDLPIVYGKEVLDWWSEARHPTDLTNGKIAWVGNNQAATEYGKTICIYRSAWDNPRPRAELASIDFVSKMELAAPFLIAITLEP